MQIIESLVANQINDFLLHPYRVHGFSETHKATTPLSTNINSTTGKTTTTATNNSFPSSSASSGISRPISVKPVVSVDTSTTNTTTTGFPSFQSNPSSPSPTQLRSEFRPSDSSGSFMSGTSKSMIMTGRNRRRQLIVECRRLRSEVRKE